METEKQAEFEGWAKVEVMGHQSHIGYVRTEAYGAAVLFRVDTPELIERTYELQAPKYVDENWCPKGTKVQRPASPGVSVLVGAGSIYRIVPCSEAAAMRAIEENGRSPLKVVELPDRLALEACPPPLQNRSKLARWILHPFDLIPVRRPRRTASIRTAFVSPEYSIASVSVRYILEVMGTRTG